MEAGGDLVKVAWARDEAEAGLIQGLLEDAGIRSVQRPDGINGPRLGFGLLNPGGGSRTILVNPSQAEEAKRVLGETLVEAESEVEPVNAEYLADAQGRRPRRYGLIGGYARIYLVSFGAMGLAFAVFLIARGL
jgi:Putative prokaryotic signal transducing protein